MAPTHKQPAQSFLFTSADTIVGDALARRSVIARPDPASGNGVGPSSQKLRGGYYTPRPLAEFLAEWAIQRESEQVLEPSAGDGEIVAAAGRRLAGAGHITALELDRHEAEKAASRVGEKGTVIGGDFFAWFRSHRPDRTFDAVLGNPPFIRYHDFPEEHRQPAFEVMREEGLKPSRLTNAWLPFVVAATRALRPGGRLAMVLPAELLQVTYAAELREYLARKFAQLVIVTFRRLVFAGLQQETVLLLGVRQDVPAAQISLVELEGIGDLLVEQVRAQAPPGTILDHAREKWTQYYLSSQELALIRELERSPAVGRLGDLAVVDVGVVTGCNDFFVQSLAQAEHHGLLPWCLPLVGRSAQIPGLVLRKEEWEHLAAAGSRCFLLQLGNAARSALSESALRYVELGEKMRYHEGYKCALRLPRWWDVPSVRIPDAFLLRQIHDGPRIVQNRAGATSTDTIHRVWTAAGVDSGWLAAASVNSLTLAFSEIRGRSYGGGVLELEPTEAEGLPFPSPPSGATSLSVDDLDSTFRRGGIEAALAEVDRLVLSPAGLEDRDIAILRGIWQKLSERRRRRNHRKMPH
ncbi:MAG: class I SAM-dependent methyltransferase [Chloroflexi bacterium]|nr:class I SAM-dependent methyltransferase [Chloroflexota bacterium]